MRAETIADDACPVRRCGGVEENSLLYMEDAPVLLGCPGLVSSACDPRAREEFRRAAFAYQHVKDRHAGDSLDCVEDVSKRYVKRDLEEHVTWHRALKEQRGRSREEQSAEEKE